MPVPENTVGEGVVPAPLPHLAGYQLGKPDTLEAAIAERDAWVESAAMFSRSEEYYRGLLDQIAEHIGPEAWKADNGDVVDDEPVRARLPDLVKALATPPVPENTVGEGVVPVIQAARAWCARQVEGDSDNPLRVAAAEKYYAGQHDDRMEIAAFIAGSAFTPPVPDNALREAAAELADLVDDIVSGNYAPDSFTTQPIRRALAALKGSAS